MISTFLDGLKDHRRTQGRRYEINFIILFAIMAILSNAKSYRRVASFIKMHFPKLKEHFYLKWRKPPGYTTIRNIIKGTDPHEIEACFRSYSQSLIDGGCNSAACIAVDGKVIRGSFDHFEGKDAIQVLSLFDAERGIILAHEEVSEKTNEIPVFQELLKSLGIGNAVYTLDALHCQKKPSTLLKKMVVN